MIRALKWIAVAVPAGLGAYVLLHMQDPKLGLILQLIAAALYVWLDPRNHFED